ncbi:hypothetical protein TI03_00235 [Achromatium sp. WMS1]|nr:hypothetical protein TI03_00235 [Achromatium sp. WMS1]
MNIKHKTDEDRLKRLLLGSELEYLSLLHKRVGDDQALRNSMQPVLVDVLREVGIKDHARLAAVLAPLVLSSLREEIRNSRDLMVDALYPITGRLVKASVKNAFRQLLETINKRLDESISLERWQIRLQARMRGISEAELLLEREPPFEIQDLILLHRSTGLLIARIETPLETKETQFTTQQPQQEIDSDLIGGMLTAIITFTKDAFGGQDGDELNTLTFGDSELYLHMSPATIMAVRVRGTRLPGFEEALGELFHTILERWGDMLRNFDGALIDDQAPALQEDLRQQFTQLISACNNRFRPPSRKGAILIIAIICSFILWSGWFGYNLWQRQQALNMAQQTVNTYKALTNYPLAVELNDAGDIQVTGIVSDAKTLQTLRTEITQAVTGYKVNYQVSALPPNELTNINTNLQAMQADIAQLRAKLNAQTNTLQDVVTNLNQLPKTIDTDILKPLNTVKQTYTRVTQLLAEVETELMSPTQRLLRWTTYNSISFKDGTHFAYPEQANIKLRTLVNLLTNAPQTLRITVVGYTDLVGHNAFNQWLALQRSLVVIKHLTDLGIPRKRLLSAGRYTENMLTKDPIETTANRQVKFELIW